VHRTNPVGWKSRHPASADAEGSSNGQVRGREAGCAVVRCAPAGGAALDGQCQGSLPAGGSM